MAILITSQFVTPFNSEFAYIDCRRYIMWWNKKKNIEYNEEKCEDLGTKFVWCVNFIGININFASNNLSHSKYLQAKRQHYYLLRQRVRICGLSLEKNNNNNHKTKCERAK